MERLNSYQGVISSWKEGLGSQGSVEWEHKRVMEENRELEEAIKENNLPHIAEEAGDMIIGLLQIINLTGHDAEGILDKKLEVIFQKYNPIKHSELRANGHSFEEAMSHQKLLWKGK